MAESNTRLDGEQMQGGWMTTSIHLHAWDCWASCSCGYSMRVPSPHSSVDKTKMPVFCCGCGKRIVYTGSHRWLPHEFIQRPPVAMNWGGKKIGDILPWCVLCGEEENKHKPSGLAA